jgi:hypothetical protein
VVKKKFEKKNLQKEVPKIKLNEKLKMQNLLNVKKALSVKTLP